MGALIRYILGYGELAKTPPLNPQKQAPFEPPLGSTDTSVPANEPAKLTDPSWLVIARKYVGEKEIKGPHHNPLILRWWKELDQPFKDDETAWCGGFVGGVLVEDGRKVISGPAAARSYLNMPVKLNRAAYGCIVVFERGNNGWSGHVGFVVGIDKHGNLMVLAGNQGDMVSIKPFSKARVLGYVWPGIMPYPERFKLPLLDSDGRVSTNEA